ncbi:hypothetical protein HNQ77_000017 [Silvibacterium bohemicum]|uniref:Uncharacterized protein n=1 Tax=Silvibacterium bohemicum TaxID=1577686 RepID=A0A841JQL4_9BACT|nr:hypothetical protein [Silvibacterium bohemicum]
MGAFPRRMEDRLGTRFDSALNGHLFTYSDKFTAANPSKRPGHHREALRFSGIFAIVPMSLLFDGAPIRKFYYPPPANGAYGHFSL